MSRRAVTPGDASRRVRAREAGPVAPSIPLCGLSKDYVASPGVTCIGKSCPRDACDARTCTCPPCTCDHCQARTANAQDTRLVDLATVKAERRSYEQTPLFAEGDAA